MYLYLYIYLFIFIIIVLSLLILLLLGNKQKQWILNLNDQLKLFLNSLLKASKKPRLYTLLQGNVSYPHIKHTHIYILYYLY